MIKINIKDFESELEVLRLKILENEKKLVKYGFDQRRGIESYYISDIKSLIKKSNNSSELTELIKETIHLQEKLYKILYDSASMEYESIDNYTPEKNLLKIKEKIIEGKVDKRPSKSNNNFTVAIKKILNIAENDKDIEESSKQIVLLLKDIYQRTYDHDRILMFLIKNLPSKDKLVEKGSTLNELATFFLNMTKRIDFKKYKQKIYSEGKKK